MRTPRLAFLALAVVALAYFAAPAVAENNLTGVAVITNTARVPGTETATPARNQSANGVYCTFRQSSESGNPSTVISVEVQDVTSGQWQALGSSTAVTTATASPGTASLMVYPGAVATSVPSGLVVSGLKVGALWRLKQVITGGTSTTGSASCDLLN